VGFHRRAHNLREDSPEPNPGSRELCEFFGMTMLCKKIIAFSGKQTRRGKKEYGNLVAYFYYRYMAFSSDIPFAKNGDFYLTKVKLPVRQ
jgi:hypothetical protein